MDFNAILTPLGAFFSDGIGKIIFDVLQAIYGFLYPSNADAAYPIEIPK